MKRLAIFASGNGSNAQNIAEYFDSHPQIRVALILSNKPDAYVLKRAQNLGIPTVVFDREEFYNTDSILQKLQKHNIDFIVLAGFLWLIPKSLIDAFPRKIINIHPALLPRYGGKGMYGNRVHRAVLDAGETQSGITIHYVNERYDEGDIIFQAKCPVFPEDTVDSLANRIHGLEYKFYPQIIEKIITDGNP